MSGIIMKGGKTFEPTTTVAVPVDPDTRASTAAGLLVWEAVICMQVKRSEALTLWQRMQKLQERADARPDHPDIPKVHERLSELNNDFLAAQVSFLGWESTVVNTWRECTPEQRVAEDMPDLVHTHPVSTAIYPLWHQQIGHQEGAPTTCPMTTTALQFTSPAMQRHYRTNGLR